MNQLSISVTFKVGFGEQHFLGFAAMHQVIYSLSQDSKLSLPNSKMKKKLLNTVYQSTHLAVCLSICVHRFDLTA